MHDKTNESDWKAFQAMVPELRERYLRTRNLELVSILQNDALSPTEQFWTVEERVREEAKILRSCLDGHTRSNLVMFAALMYRHKILLDGDMGGFSEELRGRITQWGEF